MFNQLNIFKLKTFPVAPQKQIEEPTIPTGESSLMGTLPAYLAYLESSNYAPSTTKKYFADIKRLSIFLQQKKVGEITTHDLQQLLAGLVPPQGERLDRKTTNRKVSAVITYFSWLTPLGAITDDPTTALNNARVRSPLPEPAIQIQTLPIHSAEL